MVNISLFKEHYSYPWRYPVNWIRNIKEFFKNIKWSWQRAKYGVSDYDAWDLDGYFVKVLINGLDRMMANLHGAPIEFYDEENDSAQPWIDYLTEAKEHLKNYLDDDFDEHHVLPYDWNTEEEKKEVLQKWAAECREHDEWRAEEVCKGLEMIAKVYPSLWD